MLLLVLEVEAGTEIDFIDADAGWQRNGQMCLSYCLMWRRPRQTGRWQWRRPSQSPNHRGGLPSLSCEASTGPAIRLMQLKCSQPCVFPSPEDCALHVIPSQECLFPGLQEALPCLPLCEGLHKCGSLPAGEQKFPAFSLHIAPSLQPQEIFTGPSALKDLGKALAGHPKNAPMAEVGHHCNAKAGTHGRLFSGLLLRPAALSRQNFGTINHDTIIMRCNYPHCHDIQSHLCRQLPQILQLRW